MDVAYEEPGRQIFFPALNLSATGVFLGSRSPPDVGSQVRVVLSLPPRGIFVRMRGSVVRHGAPSEPQGFAVAFETLDERTQRELQDFVRTASV